MGSLTIFTTPLGSFTMFMSAPMWPNSHDPPRSRHPVLGSLAALTAEDQRQHVALLVGQRGQAVNHLLRVLG